MEDESPRKSPGQPWRQVLSERDFGNALIQKPIGDGGPGKSEHSSLNQELPRTNTPKRIH
jgi:hypothetical protein